MKPPASIMKQFTIRPKTHVAVHSSRSRSRARPRTAARTLRRPALLRAPVDEQLAADVTRRVSSA
jgi:hypothetical protein